MKTWKSCRIGQVVEITQGLCINKQTKHLLADSGYPLLRITDLINNTQEIFIDVHKVRPRFLAKQDELIYSRTGQVGLVFKERMGIIHNNCFSIRAKEGLSVDYLFWFLRSNFAINYANSVAGGSAQPDLPHAAFNSMPICYPNLVSQQKIASILSAYDDLIENNKRRIAILEKMAEEIYREWFVRMRFSGYEGQRKHSGLPSGWQLLPFSKAVRINPRETPGYCEDFAYVGMEALSTSSMYFTYKERRTSKAGSKFRNGDVLFPRITPSLENGKRGYVSCLSKTELGVGSTEFIVFREGQIPKEYIYMISCSSEFRKHAEQSMIGASGRQRVHEKCFDSFLIRVPTKEVNAKFATLTAPMFEMVANLSRLNVMLANQRDLLLPRLISGKLSVEDLELPSNVKLTAVSSALPQQVLAHA